MSARYKVLCRVSGGITGTREAYLKDHTGNERVFDSKEAAEAEAAKCYARLGSIRTAHFGYFAVPA